MFLSDEGSRNVRIKQTFVLIIICWRIIFKPVFQAVITVYGILLLKVQSSNVVSVILIFLRTCNNYTNL